MLEQEPWRRIGEAQQFRQSRFLFDSAIYTRIIMTARLSNSENYAVTTRCPDCRADTIFQPREEVSRVKPVKYGKDVFAKTVYVTGQCVSCHRGSLATIVDDSFSSGPLLVDFLPQAIESLPLPPDVPPEIEAEFREAEKCVSIQCNRAASALFRSTLEKALKASGYTRENFPRMNDLQKRIDAATEDGVITRALQRRAHEEIRVLGNDVLHDEWRLVTDEEVTKAHAYLQRILESLYDDRSTVEALLLEAKRIPQTGEPAT
ncbi:DUF4145 domain-containing protein [Acidipila sp. EB88]|uniref:DUF4145 domain-containing protein n=1 Tax=Acidipila sp. EB88 TaxID=2305226 RepID=UPI000F5FC56F|nr:DUF4145 domain-containing protein [Acidipila sp. EB88]RRA47616.1 DUF4145 domain-containing protein [Acidipila sp. EB88]